MNEKSFHQWAEAARRWLRAYPKRAGGLGAFFLGCALAALSRAGGGDPFQEFSAGLLLGLGVGCMAVGAVTLALSLKDEL